MHTKGNEKLMATTPFDQSRIDHPDLPVRLLTFFDATNAKKENNTIKSRTVQEFLSEYAVIRPNSGLQPQIVAEMCRRLVRFGWMTEMGRSGMAGLGDSFFNVSRGGKDGALSDPSILRMLMCAAYGFPAVYDQYAEAVLPITNESAKGVMQIGTCFASGSKLLITALHCVQPAAALSIRGLEPEALRTAKFYSHPRAEMDLACIVLDAPLLAGLPAVPIPRQDATILEDVMVAGYPSVPGFHPALAAEAATISARITAVRGRVASTPTELWTDAELFLITARVRGGFSGGPVFDGFGQAIGVVSREPASESGSGTGHQYDNAGYGTAIPASTVLEMVSTIGTTSERMLDMSHVKFEAFT